MTESHDSRGRSIEQIVREWLNDFRGPPSVGASVLLPWFGDVDQEYTVIAINWFKKPQFRKRLWYATLEAQCVLCTQRFTVTVRPGCKGFTRTCETHRGKARRAPRGRTFESLRTAQPVRPITMPKVDLNSREIFRLPEKPRVPDHRMDAIRVAVVEAVKDFRLLGGEVGLDVFSGRVASRLPEGVEPGDRCDTVEQMLVKLSYALGVECKNGIVSFRW